MLISNTVVILIPTIWIPNFLKFGFQIVWYSNGRSLGYVLWMSPPCHFYSIPHSETRPFSIQPLFNHSYTRLLWHSDPHCIYKSLASYLIYSRFIGQFSTVKGHIYKSKTFYLICSRFNGHRRMAELERPRRVHERLRGSSRITHEKITWSGNYSCTEPPEQRLRVFRWVC